MISALHSQYVIDGVPRELSPARILGGKELPREDYDPIVDETTDPALGAFEFHSSRLDAYLEGVCAEKRIFPRAFPENYTRLVVASSLVDFIWRKGDFRIGDLCVGFHWKYDDSRVGNMAALYSSVGSAAEYVDGLGLPVSEFSLNPSSEMEFGASVSLLQTSEDDVFISQPFRSGNPSVMDGRIPSKMVPDPQSWLIYVPFDTADFRLGGSLLAQTTGNAGGTAPALGDVDYFIDCYEVVRELVQDGILLAGCSVGEGGLLKALRGMTDRGAEVDVSDMAAAVGESDVVRLMFSEIPGALIQISDIDFDYVDAELLLQDVAYFPLGHPSPDSGKIRVKSSSKNGIQKILESLIQNQSAEGED